MIKIIGTSNEAYQKRRNALIPAAEIEACAAAGEEPPRKSSPQWEAWARNWSLAFHAAMERTAREHGLSAGSGPRRA